MSATFDLKARLEQMKLAPKKSLGQNFLVNPEVIGRIVNAAVGLNPRHVIEIGPGLGALTEPLIAAGLTPRLVELDPDLIGYWRGRGLEVEAGDALRLNWVDLVAGRPTALVSNLPYNISTSLVVERCAGPAEVTHMVLMFQKEVAERLTARPRGSAYGLLSVVTQWHFELKKVADAAPRDFYPAPKVASRVLRFARKLDVAWDPRRLTFLKGAFAFRRKFLVNNLKSVVDKSKHDRLRPALGELGFKDTARAEELSPAQFTRLFDVIYGN